MCLGGYCGSVLVFIFGLVFCFRWWYFVICIDIFFIIFVFYVYLFFVYYRFIALLFYLIFLIWVFWSLHIQMYGSIITIDCNVFLMTFDSGILLSLLLIVTQSSIILSVKVWCLKVKVMLPEWHFRAWKSCFYHTIGNRLSFG